MMTSDTNSPNVTSHEARRLAEALLMKFWIHRDVGSPGVIPVDELATFIESKLPVQAADKGEGELAARVKELERKHEEASAEVAACLEFLDVELGWEYFREEMLYHKPDEEKKKSQSAENARTIQNFLKEKGHGIAMLKRVRDAEAVNAGLREAAIKVLTTKSKAYVGLFDDDPLFEALKELRLALSRPATVTPQTTRIYVASKTRHAKLWKEWRNSQSMPIVSTWIDEAGEGETSDWNDLWNRCVTEAKTASAIVVLRDPGDTLKGALVEIGAALSAGVPVFYVGDMSEQGTWHYHKLCQRCDTVAHAFQKIMDSPAPTRAKRKGEATQ
jgi:hypothetical protein